MRLFAGAGISVYLFSILVRMFLKQRTFFTLITAAIIIILTGLLRNQNDLSISGGQTATDRFWIMKAQNKSKNDVVLIGDSRTYRGLDPDEMKKFLPGMSIYNFAFSSGGLNPQIYEAAEKLLDPESRNKTILIGIDPGALNSLYEGNYQYNLEHNRPRSAYLERVYINPTLQIFTSFADVIFGQVTVKQNANAIYVNHYHDNGWVGSYKIPEDTGEALPLFRSEMEKYKTKPELVKALIDQTRDWTSKGIRVFAFRTPASYSMLKLENEMSRFDEKSFVRAFESAGGTWIPVDPSQYHSYDGSHIDEVSAKRLSAYVAKEMAKKYKF
jgi:hypothetical protein